jgi:hypothetical protein
VALSDVLSVGETERGPHRRAVGSVGATHPRSPSKTRRTRKTLARSKRCSQWHLVDTAYRSALERPTRALPSLPDLPPSLPEMDRGRGSWQRTRSFGRRSRRAWADRPLGVLHRRHIRHSQKRGACVGKTKRGKGSKIMAFSDSSSVPLALHTESASPHEVSLVEATLASSFLREKPKRLIGDKAYDSDPLDESLLEQGIEMIAPHKKES